MRGKLILFTFLLLLPAFAVLGHDFYVVYADNEEKVEQLKDMDIDPNKFSMSDVGRLWIAYAPDSLNDVRDSVSLSTWENFVAPLLEQKAFLVALVPVVLMYLIVAIMWVFSVGPFGGMKVKKASAPGHYSRETRDAAKKTKYSRK